jgi:pimeloyl-ACP methyl ester carboxylesterase
VGGAGWSRARLLHFLAATAAHDAHAMLPRISAPVLVLHGERDAILSSASQQRLLARLSHASYRELPGAGHDLASEAPHSCAELIAAFLSAADPSQP